MKNDVRIKRAYEAPAAADGFRVLIDRIWPRGVSKADLNADTWLKEVAPSTALRKWFGHDPEKWDAFRHKYRDELAGNSDCLDVLIQHMRRGRVTLVYGARDETHNHAVVLRDVLLSQSD